MTTTFRQAALNSLAACNTPEAAMTTALAHNATKQEAAYLSTISELMRGKNNRHLSAKIIAAGMEATRK